METGSRNGSHRSSETEAQNPNPAQSAAQQSQGDGGSQQGSQGSQPSRAGERPQEMRGGQGRSVRTRGSSSDLSSRGMGQDPFSTMFQLTREMDRLMDAFFGRRFGTPLGLSGGMPFLESNLGPASSREGGAAALWSPRIEVEERGDSLVVRADLPGVRKEDIQIEATEEGLAISGERRQEREESDRNRGFRIAERSYGSFYRVIPLPDGANVEQAKATMSDGELEITIPVQQSQQRRQIRIET